MKRWLAALLAVLCLSGCAPQTPQEESQQTPQITTPTEQTLYDPEHRLEAQTDGAVRVYPLQQYQCRQLVAFAEHHLMVGTDTLTLLKGQELTVSVCVEAAGMLEQTVCVGSEGVAYQDAAEGSVIFYNTHLRKSSTLKLPEDVVGQVRICEDWTKIYYCTAAGVWELQVDTGISRILLAYEADWQGVTGCFQNAQVLRCRLTDPQGAPRTMLISTQTGQILSQGEHLTTLKGTTENYCLEKQTDGQVEYIFGFGQEQPCNFFPGAQGSVFALPETAAAVQQARDGEDSVLHYYDLRSGLRTACVALPGTGQLQCVGAEENVLWFADDSALYRWETARSSAEDEKVYTAQRFTREDPDEMGMRRIGQQLLMLEEKYGTRFHFWEQPQALCPADYHFETEFIPQVYETHLAQLEEAMARLPEDFLRKAAQWTDSGQLNILLVRQIWGNWDPQQYGPAPAMQFQVGREVYLVLSLQEGIGQNFYHVLGHVLDTRVLSTCDAYSQWDSLNPWDFRYDNDYRKNLDRTDTKYLEGEKRYFVDHYAMSFAAEDRVRIWEYACMPGNEAVFASRYMQKKLKTVCEGIRQALALPEGTYIWEQYLQK